MWMLTEPVYHFEASFGVCTLRENQNNIAAPSVTIAPRNPARGVLSFVITLTTHKDVRS